MIYYFSSTGNCEYVARRIGDVIGDEVCSIAEVIHDGGVRLSGGSVGIIVPTYAWGLPAIVVDFLRQLLHGGEVAYLWFVTTYGSTSGQTGYFAEKLLAAKGYDLGAKFSVKMPDNWTPMFDLSDSEKVARINAAAEPVIDFVIEKLQSREKGDFAKGKVPLFASKLYYRFGYPSMRQTSHFVVEDVCTGCGLCAKKCPDDAICMVDRKPVWQKEQCTMCLGCLHRCPKFAIQYGSKTKKHGQYRHPAYRAKKK